MTLRLQSSFIIDCSWGPCPHKETVYDLLDRPENWIFLGVTARIVVKIIAKIIFVLTLVLRNLLLKKLDIRDIIYVVTCLVIILAGRIDMGQCAELVRCPSAKRFDVLSYAGSSPV